MIVTEMKCDANGCEARARVEDSRLKGWLHVPRWTPRWTDGKLIERVEERHLCPTHVKAALLYLETKW